MSTGKKIRNNIWIISDSSDINLDLSNICSDADAGPVTEYRISELAQYLLNPHSITLKEKVIGCRIHYRRPHSGIFSLFKRKKKGASDDEKDPYVEEIISTSKITAPTFRDERLNAHFLHIIELLKPYNPAHKKLAGLDREKVEEIHAICEEISGNRYTLSLQGSINEKINFVGNSFLKKTKVVFNKAYIMNGLFEIRGFQFDSFNADNFYRLIRFTQDRQHRYCVLDSSYKFEYWIEDISLINYLHLFEQSIKTDHRLREALTLCMKGDAKPLKLFFSKQLEQKYSEKRLPGTYREMLNTYHVSPDDMKIITGALNSFQSIVFFNYIPTAGEGKHKLFTNISVLHDFKAIEPIRSQLPELYSEIDKKASVTDAGKLYLLDSIREYQNV